MMQLPDWAIARLTNCLELPQLRTGPVRSTDPAKRGRTIQRLCLACVNLSIDGTVIVCVMEEANERTQTRQTDGTLLTETTEVRSHLRAVNWTIVLTDGLFDIGPPNGQRDGVSYTFALSTQYADGTFRWRGGGSSPWSKVETGLHTLAWKMVGTEPPQEVRTYLDAWQRTLSKHPQDIDTSRHAEERRHNLSRILENYHSGLSTLQETAQWLIRLTFPVAHRDLKTVLEQFQGVPVEVMDACVFYLGGSQSKH